ncbi:MAG: NAD+ synthase, partial [Alphaproteobacteria bacterium]|nr:NAD+ synthase [Alphaproteobacteria bacterium]
MADRLAIALAQIDPVMGDVAGNVGRIRAARREAAAQGADLVVFPELCVPGYPPEDLILKPFFLDLIAQAVEALAEDTADGGPGMVIGTAWREDGKVYNAGALLDGGTVKAVRFKYDLPNYGVFDEKRVFAAGALPLPSDFRGVRLGLMVCEDMWSPDPAEALKAEGAEILVVPNGSPFSAGKPEVRRDLARARARETGLPLIYVNQVGGQDELVFDGQSFIIGRGQALKAQLPSFSPALRTAEWFRTPEGWDCRDCEIIEPPEGLEAIYRALVLGLRDYVGKNRFPGVIIGLSGGIDSALSAAVAVDALGADKVR